MHAKEVSAAGVCRLNEEVGRRSGKGGFSDQEHINTENALSFVLAVE